MKSKLPEIGSKRIVKKFAWLPIVTDDRYKVWLEHVYDEEEFKTSQAGGRWFRNSRKAKISNAHEFITEK